MDRLAELSATLSSVLDELQTEASKQDLRRLMAPLGWLDEANGWLRYELSRLGECDPTLDDVPFTYVPLAYRK